MMPRFRLSIIAMLIAMGLLSAAPSLKDAPVAKDDSLKLIPANSMIVLQVGGMQRVQDRAQAMLENSIPDKAPQITKQLNAMLAELLAGRDPKVILPTGRIYIAVADVDKLPDGGSISILVPTKDAEEFKKTFLTEEERKSLGKEGDFTTVKLADREEQFFLVPIPGYVALCSQKELAESYASKKAGGLDKAMSDDTSKAFMDSDVGIFINVKEINAKYGDQLKAMKGFLEPLLKGVAEMGGAGVNKAQIEQVKAVLDGLLQIVEDGVGGVVSIEFRPEGLNFKFMAQFGEKTETNKVLKNMKPGKLSELGSLPSGHMIYSAGKLTFGKSTFGEMVNQLAADDPNDAVKAKLKEAIKGFSDLEQGVSITAGGLPGNPALAVSNTKDASKLVDAQLKLLKLLTKDSLYANVPLKEKPVIKEKAQKVGSLELHAITMKFDLEKLLADVPEEGREVARNAMKKMMPEETTTWVGSDGNNFWTVTGKDWNEAKVLVEAYSNKKDELEKDSAYQKTRKQMPGEACYLLVIDAAPTAHYLFSTVKESIANFPGLPIALPDLKAPSGKPAYLGMSVVLKAEHGSFDLFVPTEAVGQIRKYLAPLLDKDD